MPGKLHFAPLRADGEPLLVFKGIVIMRFNGPVFFGNEQLFKTR